MALVVFDGFDHYGTIADLQARTGELQWTTAEIGGADTISLIEGRGGTGQAVQIGVAGGSGATLFGGSFASNFPALYLGIAVATITTALPYFDLQIMSNTGGRSGQGAPQLTIRCYVASGSIQVFSGDPDTTGTYASLVPTQFPLGSSPPNAFNPFAWNYFEIYVLAPSEVAGAVGAFDVHVNGTSVISSSDAETVYPTPLPDGSALGVNTYNGFRIRTPATPGLNGTGIAVDDFYLCDTTTGAGTYPMNTFCGDVAVRTLNPTGNFAVQWTPLAETNWQEVGETAFDGDASYNSATAIGSEDLFTFAPLPTTYAAVFGLQITGAYRKLDASAQTIEQQFLSGGTELAGGAKALTVSYAYFTDLSVLDPHTNATWTPTAVNSLVAGYKLTS